MRTISCFKKILAALLLLVISFSVFSATVFALTDEERANRFVSSVGEFSEIIDLDDKKAHLDALKGDFYFSDESYTGVSEALRLLQEYEEEIESLIETCEAFINAVGNAYMIDADDYVSLKLVLVEAEQYLGSLDNTYNGVTGALEDYRSLLAEIREREVYTDEFLALVASASGKTDYKTLSGIINTSKFYLANDLFLVDYPGVSDALATLDDVDEFLAGTIAEANKFVALVNGLGAAEDIRAAIISAYQTLALQDLTAPGVSNSKTILDATRDSYNEKINKINADWDKL